MMPRTAEDAVMRSSIRVLVRLDPNERTVPRLAPTADCPVPERLPEVLGL